VADVFDNASVDVRSPDLRVEVVRERGIVSVDIGPADQPGLSYDSGLVLNYLGLSSGNGLVGPDARVVLHGAGAFIKSAYNELRRMFGAEHLAHTKEALSALADERMAKMFGRPPQR
jgi:hypothetical protein